MPDLLRFCKGFRLSFAAMVLSKFDFALPYSAAWLVFISRMAFRLP